ncbi:MAG: hypothetical protein ACKO1J_17870, partial [Tagaea sp.]
MVLEPDEWAAIPGLVGALEAGEPSALARLRALRSRIARACLDGIADPAALAALPECRALIEAGLTRFPADPGDAAAAAA